MFNEHVVQVAPTSGIRTLEPHSYGEIVPYGFSETYSASLLPPLSQTKGVTT